MISKKAKSTASGIIEAPLIEVSTLLLTINPGRAEKDSLPLMLNGISTPVEIGGGPGEFTVTTSEGSTIVRLCFIKVDRANESVCIYGGWWFMSEYTIEPHGQGSVLTYSLYNAATGLSGAIAGLLHRRELAAAEPTLAGILQRISERLNCSAHLIQ